MKLIDFAKWLRGYLDALAPMSEDLGRIEDKLDEVDMDEPSQVPPTIQFPPNVRKFEPDNIESEDGRVPFYEVCPCNPRNGGNGVCNCTMANKLVYPANFTIKGSPLQDDESIFDV